jgi:DNA helicase II / ATP-dependent DNA helicase PcrA
MLEDISKSLDDLLATPPAQLKRAFAGALDALHARAADHTILGGPKLPDISPNLDIDQRAVLECGARTLRLLAPAGAGKTHCITNKILQLLKAGELPQTILVVTFDNNAANELRARASSLIGECSRVRISTLNSFGLSLLREYKFAGTPPRLINQVPAYQHRILRSLLEQLAKGDKRAQAVLPSNVKRTYYLSLFSYLKNQLYSVRGPRGTEGLQILSAKLTPIISTSAAPLLSEIGRDDRKYLIFLTCIDWLFRSYEQAKDREGYIDFDDQKLIAFELLHENEPVCEAVQGRYRYVVVDEFQDLNELDFRLILLVARSASLIVVGDDDQAIYGFRGTSPRYIINLEALSGRATTTLELRKNYRSPENIVGHATRLIRRNNDRIDKNPVAANGEACAIRLYNALTPSAEASMIGEFIQRVVDAGSPRGEYRNIAVLYRMNAQSLPLQLELIQRGIPYYCRKQDNILGQEYLPRVLSMTRYVCAVRAGTVPDRGDFLEAIRAYFHHPGREFRILSDVMGGYAPPYLDALEDTRLRETKLGRSAVKTAVYELTSATTPLAVLEVIGRRFRGIRGMVGSLEEAVTDELPLGELGDVAVRFGSLAEFAVFLEDAISRARSYHTEDYDANSVRLLTYFRSKGAQFETVILPSLNSGIIPHYRAPIEDERRLFYVAVTRTRKNLWMSYVKRVCNRSVELSQFVKELELPRDCVLD